MFLYFQEFKMSEKRNENNSSAPTVLSITINLSTDIRIALDWPSGREAPP